MADTEAKIPLEDIDPGPIHEAVVLLYERRIALAKEAQCFQKPAQEMDRGELAYRAAQMVSPDPLYANHRGRFVPLGELMAGFPAPTYWNDRQRAVEGGAAVIMELQRRKGTL